MGAYSVVAEWYPGAAASNANDNFIDQVCPRVREYGAVSDHTGVRLLAREHLFKERFRVIDLSVSASKSIISRSAFGSFLERNPSITCFSSSRSVSMMAIGSREIYWIIRQSQLSS